MLVIGHGLIYRSCRFALSVVVILFVIGIKTSRVSASSQIVTNNTDGGFCGIAGTLRNAICNATTSGDVITIQAGLGTIVLAAPLPQISNPNLTINGNGSVIDGNLHQVFNVLSTGGLNLNNTTIQHGAAPFGGGALANAGTVTIADCILTTNYSDRQAGGIVNTGTLTILRSAIVNNEAMTAVGGISNSGTLSIVDSTVSGNTAAAEGGIANSGTLTITNSTISNNRATSANIGGILNFSGGTVTITNSTLSGNRALTGGGAIQNSGTMTLVNSTLSGHLVDSGNGGGILNGGTMNLKNTIVAANTATTYSDIAGAVVSQGNNLIGDGSGSSGVIDGVNGDQVGTTANPINPMLGPLANNGGLTYTMALNTGSPAIGVGQSCPVTDQRGVLRPPNNCDIGAFQLTPYVPVATYTPTATSTVTPTSTPSATPLPVRSDTIGIYYAGTFYLRNYNTAGSASFIISYGNPGDLPITGDWNGDSVDTIGVYRSTSGFFYLSNSNNAPNLAYTILFGNPGDTPFAGRWTADMTHDGIGVYRNTNGILYQRKSLTSGFDDFFAVFGNPGDQGIAGDWDGNGFDSIGVYRSSNQTWFLTNNSTPSGITFSDINFVWNANSGKPIVGDWDGDGDSTVGFLTSSGTFTLHSNNATAGADSIFAFGPTGGLPIAGKWVTSTSPNLNAVIDNQSNGFADTSKVDAAD